MALSAWGSEETLEREHRLRDDKRDKAKAKKFDKQIKALRMQVSGVCIRSRIDPTVYLRAIIFGIRRCSRVLTTSAPCDGSIQT